MKEFTAQATSRNSFLEVIRDFEILGSKNGGLIMPYKILVANMPLDTSGNDLKELFAQVGTVGSVSRVNREELLIDLGEVIQTFVNRITHTRPFYSIEMPSLDEAKVAIARFQGIEFPDRPGYTLLLSGPHGPGDEP